MADCYVGEIRIFAGNYAPEDWVICDGRTLTVSGNEVLFSLIGTTYGGDGRTNFNLPDLRGRLPIGAGSGKGLTKRNQGDSGGTDTVTLDESQIAPHSHVLNATSAAANSVTPGANMTFGTVGSGLAFYNDGRNPTTTTGLFSPLTVGQEGGSSAHGNTMPTFVLNYIIATKGLYPNFS